MFLTFVGLSTLRIHGKQFLFSSADGPGGDYGASQAFGATGMPIAASTAQPFVITSSIKGPNSYQDPVITGNTAPVSLGSTTQPSILPGQLVSSAAPINNLNPVPEPSFCGVIGLSLVGLALVIRKVRRM